MKSERERKKRGEDERKKLGKYKDDEIEKEKKMKRVRKWERKTDDIRYIEGI